MDIEPHARLNRRQFLPAAAGAAAAGVAGLAGYELRGSGKPEQPSRQPSPIQAESPAETFVTRPDLQPPAVAVTRFASYAASADSPRFILLAPASDLPGGRTQAGLMVVDRQGRLVWFQPTPSSEPFDLNVQPYRGRPVLTWWQGAVRSAHGYGNGEMADGSYRTIATIRAGDGLQADLHELQLTSAGTALITAYEQTTTSLSALGGPRRAPVFVGHAQEIDLSTGKVLLDWNSLEHVGVEESNQPLPPTGGPFDYFHINSISEMDDGNLLISARNTWTLYKVDRSSGKVIWRLNGKRSDFSLSPAARFYWQHHARPHGGSALTVFDNAGPKRERQSRGLLLALDERSRRVELTRAYTHPAGFLANTLGSVQLLPDGRVFVGWGDQPYFSEFAPDGTLLLDGQLPFATRSYRAFTADWVGRPGDAPRIVSRANPAGGFVVHVSWNGATEIDRWVVLAGPDRSSLEPVGSQAWSGFETGIAVNSTGPYFAAAALDSRGRELGRSQLV